ncbi:MAG: hypothetical protein RLZZ491_50 [Pseudomonadota bacterium]|jgi:hypothetical protein
MAREMITLADLRGGWQLSRQIVDHRAGVTGTLTGRCDWTPDGLGLRQSEDGMLHFGSAPPMPASRVYLWRAEGHDLAVFFEDGRPFHRLGPGQWADRHRCAPDLYDVAYAFGDWPEWTQRWRVTGPRKDLTIESRFVPLGGR